MKLLPFLLLTAVLVPLVPVQQSFASTVFLGRAEGMIVTTNYQSSEAAEGAPEEAKRLLGMVGDQPKTAEVRDEPNTIGKGEGKIGATEAEPKGAWDQLNRSVETSKEATKLCNEALLHIQRDNFSKAIKALEQAMIIDRGHVRARLLRGVVAEKQGKHEEAIGYYDSALALDPGDAAVYQSRGISHMEMNKSEEAISDFTRAMELEPNFLEAYLKRGLLYGRLGRFEESIADNTAAIALDPENVLAYNNRSAAYKALGKLDEARADIRMLKSLQQMPKD